MWKPTLSLHIRNQASAVAAGASNAILRANTSVTAQLTTLQFVLMLARWVVTAPGADKDKPGGLDRDLLSQLSVIDTVNKCRYLPFGKLAPVLARCCRSQCSEADAAGPVRLKSCKAGIQVSQQVECAVPGNGSLNSSPSNCASRFCCDVRSSQMHVCTRHNCLTLSITSAKGNAPQSPLACYDVPMPWSMLPSFRSKYIEVCIHIMVGARCLYYRRRDNPNPTEPRL